VSPLLLERLSDESLGSRLASGEAAAFDELYRRYVHRLAAYGAHLLGDGAAGDDVAQATLLKAYGALRAGRLPERVRPWLFRIAHNAAIDVVTRRRELPAAELPDRPAADGAHAAGALVAALSALPERQRHVYVLRELHGLRIDETAAELGMTAPQVEQALFAARNRMAEHLVFGDRLDCVAVRRLAAGPLDLDERRALKTHLRSCPECRHAVGARAPALTGSPFSPVHWLRNLGGIATGGAPLAAKVGAVVATATIAAGVPVAIETAHVHLRGRPHGRTSDLAALGAAATRPGGSSTAAAAPVTSVRRHPGSTPPHATRPGGAHHGMAAAGAGPRAVPTAPQEPARASEPPSQPPTSTTATANGATGVGATGTRDGSGDDLSGASGDGDRSGTDGTTTTTAEPTRDFSGSGDDTTQTQTTETGSSGDGGPTSGSSGGSGGDDGSGSSGTSGDTGSSGSSSGDTSSSGSGDGGSGGDAVQPAP
jgi:RNA polymerase sigma factor (sigma-70 family)